MFEESQVAVSEGDRDAGTWGGAVVGDGAGGGLTSLPSNSSQNPVVRVDAHSRRVEPYGTVGGDLRSGCLDGDSRLWLLSTHALTVFDRERRERVGVVKQGLGTYKWDVVPMGVGLVGVSGWSAKTTTLVSTEDARVVKQLRFPSLELAVPGTDSEIALYSFHAGTMATLHAQNRTARHHRDLPTGTSPLLLDTTIHVGLGSRRRTDWRTPTSKQWWVRTTRLACLDAATLQPLREGRSPRRFRRFLGVDSHGRLIAQTATSIRLLDPDTYRTLAIWTAPDDVVQLWSACHAAPDDAVVIRPHQFWVPELTVLTW